MLEGEKRKEKRYTYFHGLQNICYILKYNVKTIQ